MFSKSILMKKNRTISYMAWGWINSQQIFMWFIRIVLYIPGEWKFLSLPQFQLCLMCYCWLSVWYMIICDCKDFPHQWSFSLSAFSGKVAHRSLHKIHPWSKRVHSLVLTHLLNKNTEMMTCMLLLFSYFCITWIFQIWCTHEKKLA